MSHTARGRSHALVGIVLAGGIVAALTLAPQRIVGPLRGAFLRLVDAAAPAIAWMPADDAEVLLNTLLFVPLGAALALALGRRAWPLAILAGLAISSAVEFAQRSISGRVPDPNDVLWNTVGAAVGVIAVVILRLAAPRRPAAARARPAARRRHRGSVTRT